MQKTILNHHAATILPYHLDSKGNIYFVLEQKDPDYKRPFFDSGLNFLGGNWKKGEYEDDSPEKTLEREIKEEFWQAYEAPESLNALLGEQFLEREPQVCAHYNQASVKRLKLMSDLLQKDSKHTADYIIKVKEPIIKLTYGLTIFSRKLTEDEFFEIKLLEHYFDGKLTTDNLKWGSKTVTASLDEINRENRKFSWGYDHVINDFLDMELPTQQTRVIRPLNLIEIKRIDYPKEAEKTKTGCPTYKGFESTGYEYGQRV